MYKTVSNTLATASKKYPTTYMKTFTSHFSGQLGQIETRGKLQKLEFQFSVNYSAARSQYISIKAFSDP
jgi:hypothetical protein